MYSPRLNRNAPDLLAELREKAIKIDPVTGCWNWTRCIGAGGYGELRRNGQHYYAHRLMAHLVLGFDLNSPLYVCHRCDNRKCVNPEHFFFGTCGDNIRDYVAKGRYRNQNTDLTHCPQGHPYSGDNLYVTKQGFRQCVTCKVARTREWRLRNHARSIPNQHEKGRRRPS